MKPALKTTPLKAIPDIARYVVRLGGSLNSSVPDQCKKGIGSHKTISVDNPSIDVRRLGYNPNGGGYTISESIRYAPLAEERRPSSSCPGSCS